MAALTVWPLITEPYYQLAVRIFGEGATTTEWQGFTRDALRLALFEPGPESDTYVFRPEWSRSLEHELAALGGADAVRSRLVDAWLAAPGPVLASEVTVWARDLSRWDVLGVVWLILGEQTDGLPVHSLEVFRDLPTQARESYPILTWASGAAASLLGETTGEKVAAMWDRLLLDAAMLHSNWSARDDTDQAVIAGTFRMIGEQRQPGTHAGQSLDAAWRTKQEIDVFIDTRSRAGTGPGRTAQAVFRAFSARLALSRYDALSAINEARWATILSDSIPVSLVAAGVEALALSVSTEAGYIVESDPPPSSVDSGLGGVGLRGIGNVYLILARANVALRGIDQEGVDRWLALASPEVCALAGVWSIRAGIAATRAALWGDPVAGLHALAGEIVRLSRVGREQDEPIGKAILARTQTVLLVKAGAFAAAGDHADKLSERFRVLTQAWVQLWSGGYAQAAALADAAPYQPGQEIGERHTFSLVRASAGLLNGDLNEDLRRHATRELTWLVANGSFVHFAMLPRAARDALVDLVRPELASEPNFAVLLERLSRLNDSGQETVRPVRLTEREQVLLPLLATEDPVPEIARKLQVSVNTVRKQVATLRQKFEADTRSELIRKARLHGAIR